MAPCRRTLLTAGGAIGLGGGSIIFWHRRSIQRRDDIDAIETALDIAVPTVANPVTITPDHLKNSYLRARRHVETTEEILPGAQGETPKPLKIAKESLADHSPDDINDGDERHDALEAYRIAVGRSAVARGQHIETDSGSPSDELQTAHEMLRDELDAFDTTYTHQSLTQTAVQAGRIESLVGTAESNYSMATDFIRDHESHNSSALELVWIGRSLLYDAEQLLNVINSDSDVDQTAELERRYERLDERIESATEDITWAYEPDVRSRADQRWTDTQLVTRTDPATLRDDGRLAQAVVEQAKLATVADTLVEFEDVPSWSDLNAVDTELVESADDLIAEKQVVQARFQSVMDAVGDDPLGVYLLKETRRQVDRADSTLENLRENVRFYDSTEWQYELDRTALRYRSAAAEADMIPEILTLVGDEQ